MTAMGLRAESVGHLKGIGWMLVSGALFVLVTPIVRVLGEQGVHPVQAAFLRYFFGLVLILPMLLRVRALPPKRAVGWYSLRGLAHAGGIAMWFIAATRIPVAEVTALGFTAPIFATLGAALFLGEALHKRRVVAVLVAFAGTLVVLRPGAAVIDIGAVAQLIGAPMFAASLLVGKKLTQTEDTTSIVVYLSLFVTLFLVVPAAMVWETPTLLQAGLLAVVALMATLAHLALTKALRATDISITQPVWFVQLVWASLTGFLLFGEHPVVWTWIGSAMIVGSATYIAHREAIRGARVRPEETVSPPVP